MHIDARELSRPQTFCCIIEYPPYIAQHESILNKTSRFSILFAFIPGRRNSISETVSFEITFGGGVLCLKFSRDEQYAVVLEEF